MQKETIEKFIRQLDGMIAALEQAVVIGGRSQKEGEACDLLKDARLKLVEDIRRQRSSGPPGLGKQLMKACGEEIRRERKVKGWSQEELAKQMKVFVSVVESWETGETLPDQDSLEELCKVFGKDICNFQRRTL